MENLALIGKKIGMSREFFKTGQSVPVTVLKMETGRVINVINKDDRGYSAVQIGFGKIKNSKHNDNFLKSNVLDAQFQIINEPPSGVFINKEDNSQEPLIFAELDTEIEELTVVDALEKMKLGNASALMFRNSKHSGLNMIYKREDGLIGWVDPRGSRELTKV